MCSPLQVLAVAPSVEGGVGVFMIVLSRMTGGRRQNQSGFIIELGLRLGLGLGLKLKLGLD